MGKYIRKSETKQLVSFIADNEGVDLEGICNYILKNPKDKKDRGELLRTLRELEKSGEIAEMDNGGGFVACEPYYKSIHKGSGLSQEQINELEDDGPSVGPYGNEEDSIYGESHGWNEGPYGGWHKGGLPNGYRAVVVCPDEEDETYWQWALLDDEDKRRGDVETSTGYFDSAKEAMIDFDNSHELNDNDIDEDVEKGFLETARDRFDVDEKRIARLKRDDKNYGGTRRFAFEEWMNRANKQNHTPEETEEILDLMVELDNLDRYGERRSEGPSYDELYSAAVYVEERFAKKSNKLRRNNMRKSNGNDVNWSEIEKMISKVNTNDEEAVDEAMDKFNEMLGGYGIEAIHDGDQPVSGPGGYYMDILLLYVNMGDTYATTVCFDTNECEMFVGSWGDAVEGFDKKAFDEDPDKYVFEIKLGTEVPTD